MRRLRKIPTQRLVGSGRAQLSGAMLASSSDELGLALNDVVLVFACSDNFVPYLSVAIQSIIENVNPERRYDIIVLTRDLSPTSMITLTRQAQLVNNVHVGFLDVDAALGDIELPQTSCSLATSQRQ